MKTIRKSNSELMLEVHSRLSNGEIAERKAKLLFDFSPNAPSNEAMIEIIAKDIGINTDKEVLEENEMDTEDIVGIIDKITNDTVESNGKTLERTTIKINGKFVTTLKKVEGINEGDNVKLVCKRNGKYLNLVAVAPLSESLGDSKPLKKEAVNGMFRCNAMNAAIEIFKVRSVEIEEAKIGEFLTITADNIYAWLNKKE